MRSFRIALAMVSLGALAGCSLDSITFLGGTPDAGHDAPADTPMIDTPSGPLGIVVSSTTLSLPEGTTRQLMVSLTQPPPGALLVTLESSDDTKVGISPTAVLFGPTDWNVPQTVTVSGKQDADTSNEAKTITLRSTGVANPVVINANVTDDDGLSLAVSAPAVDITEGANGTVAVHLSAQPPSNVVITVATANSNIATTSQSTLTFTPTNYAVDQTLTITGMQDADTVNNMTAIDFTSPLLMQSTIMVQVTDDDVMGIAPSSTTISAPEGSTETFTVQLNQQPASSMTVMVTSANTAVSTVSPATLTFTSANFNIPQTVTVTTPNDDDVADGATTISLAATGASTRAVALSVDDDDVQDIIAAPATTLTVGEGAASQLAISLAFRPAGSETIAVSSLDPMAATVSPASVTFTAANYATPQLVTVTGVQDADAQPDLTTLRIDSTALGLTKDITIDVSEDDTLALETSSPMLTLGEGSTMTLMVRLTAQPTADTRVTVGTGSSAVATASPSSLTFTAANYNTFQPVTVTAVHDVDLIASSTTLTLAASGIPTVSIPVDSTDDDTQAIVAANATVNVTEGSTTTVGVTLAFIPTGNVDVTVASMNGAAATVAPATLSFTPANYNVPQNITITGTQDADAIAATTMISLTSGGATAAAIMVNVTDDDSLNIDLSPTTLALNEGGATGTIQVRLTAMPPATTTVMLASSDTGAVTISPASLTFTTSNYATYQPITVTVVDDLDAGDETVTITATSTGLTMKTATVNVNDDELQTLVTSTGAVTLGEAGTATFTVRLGAQPSGNTTVTLASSDPGAATVSPAMLTFTTANYGMAQTVTVTGVADLDVGNETVTISASSPGIPVSNVTATVTDDDMQAIQVASATATVAEGGSTNVGVTLAYQPGAPVVVNVASALPAVAGVTPATLTFTPSNYATPQAITITGTEDDDVAPGMTNVALTLTGATSASITVTVNDNDTLGIDLTPTALTVLEGTSGVLQVRLTAQPSAATTVNLMSSNVAVATVSTGTLTFTTSNWNVYQPVSVFGVEDADVIGANATVTATSTGLTTKTSSITVNDNDVLSIATTLTNTNIGELGNRTIGVHLTAMPPGPVTVTISNPDPGAVSLSTTTLSFTTTNFGTDQFFTVSGVDDVDVGNEVVLLSLTAPGVSGTSVTVNVTDDDIQALVYTPTTATISEGGSSTINVSLRWQPVANVTVTVSSTNSAVAAPNVTSLTFTPANYATAQPVTVTTVADPDFNYNSAQIRLTSTGLTTGTVDITVREPGIIDAIDNPASSFCIFDGTTVGVRLLGRPLSSLTLNISTTSRITATPTQLTFDAVNFGAYQYVDIGGVSAGTASMTVSGTGLTSRTTNFSVISATSPVCNQL